MENRKIKWVATVVATFLFIESLVALAPSTANLSLQAWAAETESVGEPGEETAAETEPVVEPGEEIELYVESESEFVGETGLSMTDEELFSRYVQRQLYSGMIMFSTRYGEDRFKDPYNRALYSYLKDRITQIAAYGGNAVFTIEEEDLGENFLTFSDLETTVENVKTDVSDEFKKRFAIADVVSALLFDCPYELYWYDKATDGACSWGYSISYSKYSDGSVANAKIKSLTIKFQVADGYRMEKYQPSLPAVSSDVSRVSKAVETARQIVLENESLSDMDKLTAYKEAICELTSYNSEAASVNYENGYGDPWQLVYVFDKDPSTKVVCEGYAKAFQYLCELSSFDGDVRSYLMTGDLNSGGRPEGHMWNVVSVDGATYLVDLTNSDRTTIGENGELFMVTNVGDENGYTISVKSRKVEYLYHEKTLKMYDASIRMLRNNANPDVQDPGTENPGENELGTEESPPKPSYTIRWLDEAGNELASTSAEEGTVPVYSGEKQSKQPTERILYQFDGWEPAVVAAYSDAEYRVKYKEINRWQKTDGVWYYFTGTGELQTGWQKISGIWYYFAGSGAMQTGWQKISGVWYYFAGSGAMQTGWQKISGIWYYFAGSGAMQTGWQKISGIWYYFAGSGAMQTGWQKISGVWYYFEGSGVMKTGWKKLGSSWYYLKTNGAMATGNVVISGKTYLFTSSGVCLNP